jgi:hypothetical protein
MECAARTVLGLSHTAKVESLDIPEELIAEGIHFVSEQATDLAGELSDRYYELFALVVHGRLPEEDECCQRRMAGREQPNLSLRLAPEAGE